MSAPDWEYGVVGWGFKKVGARFSMEDYQWMTGLSGHPCPSLLTVFRKKNAQQWAMHSSSDGHQ